MTVHELRYGVEMAPAGAKRKDLERWLVEFVIPGFSGGLLAIDRAVADASARLIASCRKTGHTPELEDALIAATAIVHGLQLATLNRKHFERLGVELVKF